MNIFFSLRHCEQQFLDLSYLELTEIPKSIFNYPRELNTLNLTGNLLTEIPEALQFAVNLQTLYLDENDIQYIGGENKYVTCFVCVYLM